MNSGEVSLTGTLLIIPCGWTLKKWPEGITLRRFQWIPQNTFDRFHARWWTVQYHLDNHYRSLYPGMGYEFPGTWNNLPNTHWHDYWRVPWQYSINRTCHHMAKYGVISNEIDSGGPELIDFRVLIFLSELPKAYMHRPSQIGIPVNRRDEEIRA